MKNLTPLINHTTQLIQQLVKKLKRTLDLKFTLLMTQTKKSLLGKNSHLSTECKDQLLSTELFLDHLKDLLLSLLSIQEENGHSGSTLDKLSFALLLRNHIQNTAKRFNFIYTKKDLMLKLTNQVLPCQRKLEMPRLLNGALSLQLEMKNQLKAALMSEPERVQLLVR